MGLRLTNFCAAPCPVVAPSPMSIDERKSIVKRTSIVKRGAPRAHANPMTAGPFSFPAHAQDVSDESSIASLKAADNPFLGNHPVQNAVA